jgi:hypothetical protein
MNFRGRLLAVTLLGGALLTPCAAQLVHLSFSEPNNTLHFRADHILNFTIGVMTRLDVFYDVEQQKGPVANRDPSRNFWHANFEVHRLGNFEVIRSIDSIGIFSSSTPGFSSFWLRHLEDDGIYEHFEFRLDFTDDDPDAIPDPPFVLGRNSFELEAGRSFFDAPGLNSGYGGGGFDVATAAIVPYPGIRPIPEPSTYAVGALVLLSAAMVRSIWLRRNSCIHR